MSHPRLEVVRLNWQVKGPDWLLRTHADASGAMNQGSVLIGVARNAILG